MIFPSIISLHPAELGTHGAAIAAGVAVGCYSSYEEAVGAMTSIARRQEPDPAKKKIYAGKYNRYKKVIASLEPFCKN